MIALLAIPYAVLGAILNHWRGGHKYPLLRHLPGSRYWLAGYYTIPAVVMVPLSLWAIPFVIVWFAASWDGIRRGWGAYFDLGTWPTQPDEIWWIDHVISPLHRWPVVRDTIGMSLRGLHYTVPWALLLVIAVYLGWAEYWQAIAMAPVGLLMGPSYCIGHHVEWIRQRGFGEVTWGATVAVALWLIVTS